MNKNNPLYILKRRKDKGHDVSNKVFISKGLMFYMVHIGACYPRHHGVAFILFINHTFSTASIDL